MCLNAVSARAAFWGSALFNSSTQVESCLPFQTGSVEQPETAAATRLMNTNGRSRKQLNFIHSSPHYRRLTEVPVRVCRAWTRVGYSSGDILGTVSDFTFPFTISCFSQRPEKASPLFKQTPDPSVCHAKKGVVPKKFQPPILSADLMDERRIRKPSGFHARDSPACMNSPVGLPGGGLRALPYFWRVRRFDPITCTTFQASALVLRASF